METIEQLWLKSTKVMVDKVVLMLRDVYMRGGYGDSLDLNGIERLLKNLFQKLSEYTNELVILKLQKDKQTKELEAASKLIVEYKTKLETYDKVSKLIVEYKTKLETYDKVFEEFSPANQKLIKKIKERVEEECKLQQ